MNKERNKIIAENIRKYIKASGRTQKQVANDIGISPSTMSDYLNLRSNPSHGVIQKLADYFGIVKSDIDTTYKEDRFDITSIYAQLDPPRKKKVHSYAQRQLDEQNGVEMDDDILIAAHHTGDLTDDQMNEINEFIKKVRNEG